VGEGGSGRGRQWEREAVGEGGSGRGRQWEREAVGQECFLNSRHCTALSIGGIVLFS